MHLSLLSDCFVSDTLQDAGRGLSPYGSSHRDGVLRGLAVVAVAALLAGLTFTANFAEPAAAGPVVHVAAHSTGAAVNLMHREVIGH